MPPAVLAVFAVLVVAFVVWSRVRLRQGQAQHADKTLGAMTARMGLAVEAGDPQLNLLYFQQPAGNYERTLTASGRPYGRPVRFRLGDGTRTAHYVVAKQVTRTWGCFLEAAVSPPVAAFEVVLRAPNQYLQVNRDLAERPELAEVRTGNAAVDERYLIRAADPRIAAALVPALEVLAQMQYVHLAGDRDQLWIRIERAGLPYLAYAPEEYLLALETACCALEGKAPPARLAVAA